jgi:hypothetical protein
VSITQCVAFATLISLGLLSMVNMAQGSDEEGSRVLPWLCLVLLAMALVGCKTAPAQGPGPIPPATAAAVVLCEPPPDLDVPAGSSSAQLEEVLFGAYLALRAQYLQCLTSTHKATP